MGKVKQQAKGDSTNKSSSILKAGKPKLNKVKKGDRYFNSPQNSNVAGGEGQFKGKTGKKFRKPSGTSAGAGTPPPKPKRLKKGPFKLKSDVEGDSGGNKSNKGNPRKRKSLGNKSGQNGNKLGRKGKGKHAGENTAGEVHETEQTAETKERIKKIRSKAGQKNAQKRESFKVIVKPGGKWFENDDEESGQNVGDSSQQGKFSKESLKPVQDSASKLYDKDVFAYKQACMQGPQKSDFQWMERMMRVGTLPDKMAAYVVRIQDSPVHTLHYLQNLISMVKVQSKQQCLMAADTLKDLFLEDLLPPNRKLVSFDKRGTNVTQGNDRELIRWIFEDRLKVCYNSFIAALKQMSLDNVEKIRAKAVSLIYMLMTTHPEQEAGLLQMLVNKLGDTMKKVASRALFYLNSLLETHPRMKLVVIDEVERLLFRNNIAKRAQYYGICFLNSINLHDEHPEVACKLINVYVAFFKGCIKTGDIESKMMSALLTGVNKSYPLAKEYGYKFTENTDTLYKIAHLSNFNIGIQSLSILFQLTDVDTRPNDADRYYRVLYRELLRPEVATTSHGVQFLNLIFKSMKCDNRINRVMGFTKRLLTICQNVQPNLACGILFLLSEVSKVHKGIIRCGNPGQDTAEVDASSDEEGENKGIVVDDSIKNLMKISNVKVNSDEEIEEPLVKSEEVPAFQNGNENSHAMPPISEEQSNEEVSIINFDNVKTEYKQELNDYDPNARNPCYCGAEFSLAHEIAALVKHYHPSVAHFADSLLRQKSIRYEGNPLKDFTISRFLERFVYRNSKKPKTTPGGHSVYRPKGLRNIPVNSANYLKNDEGAIPVEERFFYKFFSEKKPSSEQNNEESETESVGDDEFDDLMANYFKGTKGKLADTDDEDDDLDFAANMNVKKKSKKASSENDDEMSDEDEPSEDAASDEDAFDEDDDADEMMDLDADEMLDMDDDDEPDFEDEDGLEVFEEDFDEPPKSKKMKKLRKDLDMFAPADQFAEMLESNAEEHITGPNQLISRDNAHPKQLHWEKERDRWAKGYKKNMKSNNFNKNRKGQKNKQKRKS